MVHHNRLVVADCTALKKERLFEGEVIGLQKGKQEGMMIGKLEIAKKMLEKGVEPKFIQTCTGLRVQGIEALQNAPEYSL